MTWKHRMLRVGSLAVDVAPVIVSLTRASHPIAWVAAAAFVGRRLYQQLEDEHDSLWTGVSYLQKTAILHAAASAGVGRVARSEGGVDYRRLGPIRFAALSDWSNGPKGPKGTSVEPLVDEIWRACGSSLYLKREGESDLSLTSDPCDFDHPSLLTVEIARECCLLRDGGARVGLLIDGRPGTGKTEALCFVAAQLGDRTIRADLRTVEPWDILGVATVLRPKAVVLDDLDRGPTDRCLEVVAKLERLGIAVLASSNEKSKICEALCRDGRIDDHRTFTTVEPDVLLRLTNGLGLDDVLLERLGSLVVGQVARFVERRGILGHDRAVGLLENQIDGEIGARE